MSVNFLPKTKGFFPHDFILELEALDIGAHRIFDDEEDASEEQQSQVQEEEQEAQGEGEK